MKQLEGSRRNVVGLSSVLRQAAGSAMMALLLVTAGCDFAGDSDPGVGIGGVTQAAPKLSDTTPTGEYSPYFTTGDLGRPRYMHLSEVSQGGFAIVLGGSDERGFSGIDSVEMYDQSAVPEDAPRPESLAGVWIDTNFEGDPITFENGPRMLFTVTPIAGGRMICIGGTGDLLAGTVSDKAEVYDPETRTFTSIEADMVLPRFRHSAVRLADGGILLIAGQIQSTVTVINDQIAEGFPGRQTQVTVFITTAESEVFSLTDEAFSLLTIPGTDRASKLNTPRGRAGHTAGRVAGPDNQLNSSDDVFLVTGGFQALSSQFAPRSKQPGAVARTTADGLSTLEFYDPLTQVFTQVGNVQLAAPRINDPYVMNMGQFNDFTIDGVKGLGNVILITHGNTDEACPITPVIDELLVANYTGFGPAQGLQFFLVEEQQFASHVQGIEYGPLAAIGRCGTNPVPLPRRMVTVPGVRAIETWVFALGGVFISCCPCAYAYGDGSETVRAGCAFDPFYSLPAVQLGLSPRDLQTSRSRNNPTGVVGTWLTLDGQIPTVDTSFYGNTQPGRWGKAVAPRRVFSRNITVAGEDGILLSPDDRILLSGGGIDYAASGGEPTSPSAEIFLPPNANINVPTP